MPAAPLATRSTCGTTAAPRALQLPARVRNVAALLDHRAASPPLVLGAHRRHNHRRCRRLVARAAEGGTLGEWYEQRSQLQISDKLDTAAMQVKETLNTGDVVVQLSGAAAYPLLVDKAAAAGKSAPLQVAALVSDLRWQQLVAREKLVLLLVSELLKGEESKWQPFIQHLLSCTTVNHPADANAQEYQDFCDNLVDASVQVERGTFQLASAAVAQLAVEGSTGGSSGGKSRGGLLPRVGSILVLGLAFLNSPTQEGRYVCLGLLFLLIFRARSQSDDGAGKSLLSKRFNTEEQTATATAASGGAAVALLPLVDTVAGASAALSDGQRLELQHDSAADTVQVVVVEDS